MSQQLSRKELKQDEVALKVEETAHFFAAHRQNLTRAGIAVAAVVAIGLISWFFISSRHAARQKALADAMEIQNATVGATQTTGAPNFPSEAAKADAVKKAFTQVMTQNAGSDEGAAAEYFLAGIDVTEGKLAESLKKYDHVAASASQDYAALAKLAKAQVQFSLSNAADARATLKDLIDHPTATVSKDQANLALARGIITSNPDEAKKILEPLAAVQKSESSISGDADVVRAATELMALLPAAK